MTFCSKNYHLEQIVLYGQQFQIVFHLLDIHNIIHTYSSRDIILQITIEKTPRYAVYEEAPVRIKAMNSSIKLIFMVKEPVFRTVSGYLHYFAEKKKKVPFEEYVFLKNGSVNSR